MENIHQFQTRFLSELEVRRKTTMVSPWNNVPLGENYGVDTRDADWRRLPSSGKQKEEKRHKKNEEEETHNLLP